MLSTVKQTAASLLDKFDRSVDRDRRPVRKMNAEVLDSALTADAGAFLIAHGEVQRERVAPSGRAHEDNVAITELFRHAERLRVKGDGPRLVSHQEMDVPNPDRSHGLLLCYEAVYVLTDIMPLRRQTALQAARPRPQRRVEEADRAPATFRDRARRLCSRAKMDTMLV
jgi:hypothetical protein